MRQTLIILGFLVLILGCKKDSEIGPATAVAKTVTEAEATVTGYVIADYWAKGCSAGGLQMKVGSNFYFVANSIASDYSEPNSWPIAVLIRYESAPPDSCAHFTNRINILSIQKK